jgi:hypothetical protein
MRTRGRSEWLVAALVVIVAVGSTIVAVKGWPLGGGIRFETPYQAVLLANGQAFFGRLENIGSSYPVLKDVYYVQTQVHPETKQVTNTLVRRGGELHGPDRMVLNASHIVLIEPVTENSQIAKLITELKKQQ